jgi:hypothetical protein
VTTGNGGWHQVTGQCQATERRAVVGVGPTSVGSLEMTLRIEEGAGKFGSLLASKLKFSG